MRRLRIAVVAAALVAVFAAGAVAGRDRDAPKAPAAAGAPAGERPDGERRCRTRIEAPGQVTFNRRRDLRAGPVVFFALRGAATDPPQPRRGGHYSRKSAIAVRAGGPVLLRIPPRARRDIALVYASERDGTLPNVERVADGQSLVRVHPCPPSTPRFSGSGRVGRWTAFNGGFVYREPGCYPVQVARRGRPYVTRRVGLGERCPS
jgi:hypothetical protein